jgi:hypothetical protein
MAIISSPITFTSGEVITASDHNTNYGAIFTEFNGNIDNANIKALAGIVDSKLAQITTAAKVSGAAITSLASLPTAAGSIPTANLGNAFTAGMIIMWSGSIATIPSGWYLCTGTSGTPNLTDKFVVGAGSTYAVGDTGGSATVTLTESTMPSHSHTVNYTDGTAGSFTLPQRAVTAVVSGTIASGTTGGGVAHENRPPYYALCYIMKS